MEFLDYIRFYNAQVGQDKSKLIDESKIDYSEEIYVCELMERYIIMLREKYERKQAARCDETFQLTGMGEEDRYLYDSIAGTYIYENQFERKEIQQEIAELTGLTRKQVADIAKTILGEIEPASAEEKSKLAKMLAGEDDEFEERVELEGQLSIFEDSEPNA